MYLWWGHIFKTVNLIELMHGCMISAWTMREKWLRTSITRETNEWILSHSPQEATNESTKWTSEGLEGEMVEDSRVSFSDVMSFQPFLPNCPCRKHIPIGQRCVLWFLPARRITCSQELGLSELSFTAKEEQVVPSKIFSFWFLST